MTKDALEFFTHGPLADVETSIGLMTLFPVTVGDQEEIRKTLGHPIKESSPIEYLKVLLSYILYPKDVLDEKGLRPKKEDHVETSVEKLSNPDLENIAKVYIDNNVYLYKGREWEVEESESGEGKVKSDHSKIKYPRKEGESSIDYLHRLVCLEEHEQEERLKQLAASLPNLSNFSKGLSTEITKNLQFGESLSEKCSSSFSHLRGLSKLHEPPSFDLKSITEPPKIDWASMAQEKERIRREPFDDLSKRLDELIHSSIRASEFMVETNKIQTEIAAEIKAGGDSTERHAKTNIKLTRLVLIITLVGIAISAWSILSGISFSPDQQRIIKNHIESITTEIEKNAVESERNIDRQIVQNQQLSKLVTEGIRLLESNATASENHKIIVQELKKTNDQQREKIRELEARIIELELKNKEPNKTGDDNSE